MADLQDPVDPRTLPARARDVLDAARALLEEEGPEALSMRRVAERLELSAPALYRHFADKRTLELAIIWEAFWESGDAMHAAVAEADGASPLRAVLHGARRWALEHPHLFKLIYAGPLDRERLDPDAELHAGEALRDACKWDRALSLNVWVWWVGVTLVEIDGRFPPGHDLEQIIAWGVEHYEAQVPDAWPEEIPRRAGRGVP